MLEPSVAPATQTETETEALPAPARDERRRAKWAAWAFGAYVVAGFPIIMLGVGRYWWFFRDDWFFITDRDLSVDGLFEDHNGHWSTFPVLVFRLLWAVVGLRSYAPYKATVVIAHLAVVVCIRIIMRRYGVGPWLATVLAGSLVLFGSGREDILWAFQVGFTGSMALFLLQWILADREDAPLDKVDLLGVACGLVAVTAPSSGLPLVPALAVTLLVRRGWKAAALHAGPVLAAYLTWSLIVQPNRSAASDPPMSALVDWVTHGLSTMFNALTGYRWAAIALGLTVLAGTVLAFARPGEPRPDAPTGSQSSAARLLARIRWQSRPAIGPTAMFGATVLFILLAAQRAWVFGPESAGASRYVYAYAVFTLPIIALAIQRLGERWRVAVPLLSLLVVIGVPHNIDAFEAPDFGPGHHARQRDMFVHLAHSPAFEHAPDDLRPNPDAYNPPGLTVGFFRRALADGKLPSVGSRTPDAIAAELTIRLGLRQEPGGWLSEPCTRTDLTTFRPEIGTRFYLFATTDVRPASETRSENGRPVRVRLRTDNGPTVTVLAPDLDLTVSTVDGGPATVCIIG